jgi:hypothetical protein
LNQMCTLFVDVFQVRDVVIHLSRDIR